MLQTTHGCSTVQVRVNAAARRQRDFGGDAAHRASQRRASTNLEAVKEAVTHSKTMRANKDEGVWLARLERLGLRRELRRLWSVRLLGRARSERILYHALILVEQCNDAAVVVEEDPHG
nr:hypothetical protein CFP56_77405 [Quercus suber]